MKLTDCLTNAFPLKNESSIFQIEKYTTFEIKFETTLRSTLQINSIESIIDCIHPNDSWNINIDIENYDPISLGKMTKDISNFVLKFNKYKETIEEEKIVLSVLVTKGSNEVINIYDFDLFDSFVKELGPVAFLKVINSDLKKYENLYFNILDNSFQSFQTSNLSFGYNNIRDEDKKTCKIDKVRENCHFGNQDEYPYSPIHFNLVKRPETNNNTIEVLDSLTFIFSIICIFDITTISDTEFYYKLNGYKTYEGKLHFNQLPVQSMPIYFRIYEWIYSGPSNISDKIGLARNILSIYLKNDSLEIPESAFYSLQSGFKTYLQENLNRYIEVRNKIGEQLLVLTQRANSVLDDYLNKYQKNSLTFITFFISVLLIRVLNTGKFTDVFTKDATIIAFSVLMISAIYMIFSCIHLNSEKQRLIKKYGNLKERFQDLLIKEDIEKILRNDEEFNDEINYVVSRRNLYTIMWIVTILIFLATIISLSTFFNWNYIRDAIFN